jgi:hypothetical protein
MCVVFPTVQFAIFFPIVPTSAPKKGRAVLLGTGLAILITFVGATVPARVSLPSSISAFEMSDVSAPRARLMTTVS